jgi:two-component system CheB/CheR fusion protein
MANRFIIALGASAGGLDALQDFFDNTLPDQVSYVITTHLAPDFKSVLTQIVQKHSPLQVRTAEDNMEVEANQIYVLPENKTMRIRNGRLYLKQRDLDLKTNQAIDIFFTSLSQERNIKSIAIIFSGMGQDGTKGIEAIAHSGGYVIVQDPLTASYPSMPAHVIDSGYADQIMAPSEMPAAIVNYVANY